MKLFALIAYLAVVATTGCTTTHHETSSSRHLTEAQALALAEPMLPLPAGESYHVSFRNGTWEVFTAPDGVPVRAARVVLVQDIDGKTQVVNRF
jgi:hypothetical protein